MTRILFLILALMCSAVQAQGEADQEANRLYREGLKSYLAGDYDQAILLTAQSVQEDPASTKAKDLLTVLVAEKSRMTGKEVWLSKPAMPSPPAAQAPAVPAAPVAVPTVDLEPIWEEMRMIRMEFGVLRKNRSGERSMALARDLEHRVQVMASLLEKNTTERFEAVQAAQDRVQKKVDAVQTRGTVMASILFLMALASLVISSIALLGKGHGGRAKG